MNNNYFEMCKKIHKQLMKIRKEFRKAMGKKTIKIDGLVHTKLIILKAHLTQNMIGNNKTITLNDVIEFLYDRWADEQNGKK